MQLIRFFKSPIKRKIQFAALVFASLFTLNALLQYHFVRNQILQTRHTELSKWANGLMRELNYTTEWNLRAFRRASWEAPNSFVLSKEGTLLDAEGFIPGLVNRAALPEGLDYDRPQPYQSEVGEPWRLLAKKVHGGTILLGVPYPDNIQSVDIKLIQNSRKFGLTLDSAMRVIPREIEGEIDYCVVDSSGELRYAIGGVPVKATSTIPISLNAQSENIKVVSTDDHIFSIFVKPILDSSNQFVGTILIPKDITFEERALRTVMKFNIIIGILSWSIALVTFYLFSQSHKHQLPDIPVTDLLMLDESDTLEFKSSLRWDYDKNQATVVPQKAVINAIAGFLNAYGGYILIGVDDNKNILGIQRDYETFSEKKTSDGFQNTLQQIVSERIGLDRFNLNVGVKFENVNDQDICVVRVQPSSSPVYVGSTFYVRTGNSTRELGVKEAFPYIQEHWGL